MSLRAIIWWGSWLSGLIALGVSPALAQKANFGTLTLSSDKTAGVLSGSTGGSTSLPAVVSNTDRNNKRCLGFGDPTPDHILVLQQNLPSLKLRVDSNGTDTTLVVQGPNGVSCGDDISAANKDAAINGNGWQAGSYKVWVGSATPGVRRDYTLYIRQ